MPLKACSISSSMLVCASDDGLRLGFAVINPSLLSPQSMTANVGVLIGLSCLLIRNRRNGNNYNVRLAHIREEDSESEQVGRPATR